MSDEPANAPKSTYTVVARRYRPRTFTELIGQEHVAQALSKAIATGRVGHAYLFTGARGVGKTSAARIFAKALDAPDAGSTNEPSDIAQAIDAGDDMDVIEIDGASNRGIEEIRQLRANVNVRPSRARFKIYIIDEVHMLTNQAFNALLKTLEEPPEHVKFIFCTTDPEKIPVTVLSRCQRFDFVPVKFEAIQKRLKEISRAEGYDAEDEALALLARKASGSMRDSQSLLEQVMSFSTDRITAEQVHALLGTADEGRLLALVEALRDRSPLNALAVIDEASRGGSDPGQLAEQLLNYLRDVMTTGIGGGPELLKLANPTGHSYLAELAKSWGVPTILSAIQILDESLVRMRSSVSSATLLEVALVQICQLQDLASIPALLEALTQGGPMPTAVATRPPAAWPVPNPQTSSAKATAADTNSASESVTTSEKKNVKSIAAAVTKTESTDVAAVERTQVADVHAVASSCTVVTSAVVMPDTAVNAENRSYEEAASSTSAEHNRVQSVLVPSSVRESLATATVPPKVSIASSGAERVISGSREALEEWRKAMATIDGMLMDFACMAQAIDPIGSDKWTVIFPPGSQKPKEYCEATDRKSQLQTALRQSLGREIRLTFVVPAGPASKPVESTPQSNIRAQKMRQVAEHPMIKKVCEVLGGEIIRVEAPASAPSPKMLVPQNAKEPVPHAN